MKIPGAHRKAPAENAQSPVKSGSLVVKRIEGCYDNIIKAGVNLWEYLGNALSG